MRKMAYTSSPKCKNYEREWKNYCVDAGLEDDWLEKLNSLKSFSLISICEGHEKRRGAEEKLPHINLRFNHLSFINLLSGQIQPFLYHIRINLLEIFPYTLFEISLTVQFHISTYTGIEDLIDCIISVNVSDDFLDDLDLHKTEWFESAIDNIIKFDQMWEETISMILS